MIAKDWSLWKKLGVVAVAVFLVGLGVSTVYRAGPHRLGDRQWGSTNHRTDFTVYTAAGQAVLDGTDVTEAHNRRGWYFNTPPPLAILMVPFVLLPTFWAVLLWYLISLACVVWSVHASVVLARDNAQYRGDPFVLYALPPLLVVVPLLSALARGQTTPVMLGLTIGAIYLQAKQRPIAGGVCLAGAALVKVFPGLLLAYYLWRRQWRFAVATLLALAVGLFVLPAAVFGWNTNLHYLHEWLDKVAKPAAASESAGSSLHGQLLNPEISRNQSLLAVCSRLTHSEHSRQISIGVGLLLAAMIVAAGWRINASRELLLLSAVIVWALLVQPVSWSHYFMLLILPVAALIPVSLVERHRPTQVALLVFAALSWLSGSRGLERYGLLCWGAVVLLVGLVLAASRLRTGNGRV